MRPPKNRFLTFSNSMIPSYIHTISEIIGRSRSHEKKRLKQQIFFQNTSDENEGFFLKILAEHGDCRNTMNVMSKKKAPEDWEYSEEFACSFESLEPTEEEIENASQEDLWENFEEYMESDILMPYQFDEWSDTRERWSDYLYRIKIDA